VPGAGTADQDAQVKSLTTRLLAQPTVRRLANEAELPAALRAGGVRPDAEPAVTTGALETVHRAANNADYYFVYNRSAARVDTTLLLSGNGRPYELNSWNGTINAIAAYIQGRDSVGLHVDLAPYDVTVIALSRDNAFGSGRAVSIVPREMLPSRSLNTWWLSAESWKPGATQSATTKTVLPTIPVTAKADGTLPPWTEITGLTNASGVGAYTTAIDWKRGNGAYLNLGKAVDTVRVSVNGHPVNGIDQSDLSRIDLGPWLRPGTNTITVTVSTTLYNAVKTTGGSTYRLPDQQTGLIGPVVVIPYAQSPPR
jgi:hypothetical protein